MGLSFVPPAPVPVCIPCYPRSEKHDGISVPIPFDLFPTLKITKMTGEYLMQIVFILPTTKTGDAIAARECVHRLERLLPGYSVFDVPRVNPREPSDEVAGTGVLRGYWKQFREAPLAPIVHRDRSVMLVSDVEVGNAPHIEQQVREEFIPYFFQVYRASGAAQEALYVAVQRARRTDCLDENDASEWRLIIEEDQSSR